MTPASGRAWNVPGAGMQDLDLLVTQAELDLVGVIEGEAESRYRCTQA